MTRQTILAVALMILFFAALLVAVDYADDRRGCLQAPLFINHGAHSGTCEVVRP